MRIALVGITVLLSVTLLAACGGTTALKLSTDPQVRAQEVKAQALVQSCVRKSNFLTHTGRVAFVKCVAPNGSTQQVETCVQRQLTHGNLLTKNGRSAVEQRIITNCLVVTK